MMAHRKTITVTALHARLKRAIAALPCLQRRSEKASSLKANGFTSGLLRHVDPRRFSGHGKFASRLAGIIGGSAAKPVT
jgi:hypothetical protein